MKASLSSERWEQVHHLFNEVVDLDPDACAARLDQACHDDPALRQEVESLLVRPVEDAVAVSQGLVRMRSSSQGGKGSVSLLFRWGTDMSLAALEVREKLQHRHLGFTESQLEALLGEAGFERSRVTRAARDPQPPHFMTLPATGGKA